MFKLILRELYKMHRSSPSITQFRLQTPNPGRTKRVVDSYIFEPRNNLQDILFIRTKVHAAPYKFPSCDERLAYARGPDVRLHLTAFFSHFYSFSFVPFRWRLNWSPPVIPSSVFGPFVNFLTPAHHADTRLIHR